MPSATLADQMSRHTTGLSLYKKRKLLPRPTPGQWPEFSQLSSPSNSTIELDDGVISSHEDSYITPVPSIHVARALPPTPPSNRASGSVLTAIPLLEKLTTSHGSEHRSFASTPPLERSPPTPDITPPEKKPTRRDLLTPNSLRHAASATESFITAFEDQVNSDRSSAASPPARSLERADLWQSQSPKPNGVRHIGLGLGLESEGSERTTPQMESSVIRRTDGSHGDCRTGTIDFDGNWGHDMSSRSGDEEEGTLTAKSPSHFGRAATIRRRKARRALAAYRPEDSSQYFFNESLDSYQSSFRRIDSSEDYIHHFGNQQLSLDSSYADSLMSESQWPDALPDSPSQALNNASHRRLSTLSSASTVIREALVVESTPRRMQTLRRVGKAASLRQKINMSKTDLLASETLTGRKKQGARASAPRFQLQREVERGRAEETLHPIELDSLQRDSVPVVLIPQRKSSLRRRAAFGLDNGGVKRSLPSQTKIPGTHFDQQSISYFDLPRRRKRANSEGLFTESKHNAETGIGFSPVIPKRSSSLSAPTSRVGSRAASFTSNSASSRLGQTEMRGEKQVPRQAVATNENGLTKPELAHELQLSYFPSAQITPFSHPSSTPEALEVSQARTINLYPHTNHSVNLVIQSNSRPTTSSAANHTKWHDGGDPSATVTNAEEPLRVMASPPRTPNILVRFPNSEAYSPLKNPRAPPKPPKTETTLTRSPLGESSFSQAKKESFFLSRASIFRTQSLRTSSRLRNALNDRRYSETLTPPLSRARSTSVHPTLSSFHSSTWRPKRQYSLRRGQRGAHIDLREASGVTTRQQVLNVGHTDNHQAIEAKDSGVPTEYSDTIKGDEATVNFDKDYVKMGRRWIRRISVKGSIRSRRSVAAL